MSNFVQYYIDQFKIIYNKYFKRIKIINDNSIQQKWYLYRRCTGIINETIYNYKKRRLWKGHKSKWVCVRFIFHYKIIKNNIKKGGYQMNYYISDLHLFHNKIIEK